MRLTKPTNFHVLQDMIFICIFRKRIKLFQELMTDKDTGEVRQHLTALKTMNEGTVCGDT